MEPIMRRAVGCLVVEVGLPTLLFLYPTTAVLMRDDKVAGWMLVFLAATAGAWNAEAFAIMRPRERVRDIGAMLRWGATISV
jgi:predicted permease